MRVQVESPEVDGETVRFRWSQSATNPFQDADTFFFRYEGVDLSWLAPELFYEVFLALQLRVFAAYSESIEFVFPTPVPRPTAEFWLAFHDADRVSISPLAEIGSYCPWRVTPQPALEPRTAAVFFGGGKDSTLATCLLSELYGREQIVLVQFVGPLRDDPSLWERLERRQEELMLRPARQRLGVATRRVWTDYQARFRPEGYRRRPHLELYTAGALPTLLTSGVRLSTFCLGRTSYATDRTAGGRTHYRYAKSRTEVIADQSRHYRRALKVDLSVTNVILPFNNLTAYQLLADRYPEAVSGIVMCTNAPVTKRWCYDCAKCALFALLGLCHGPIEPAFDYDRFLRKSAFIRKVVAYAESGAAPTELGNAPWQPFLLPPRSYLLTCHMIALIEPDALPLRLGPEAYANLHLLKALFGNRRYPNQVALWRRSFALLGPELGRKLAAICGEHLTIVDDEPGPHLAGDKPVEYELGTMPTRTAGVAHLWQESPPGAVAAVAEGGWA